MFSKTEGCIPALRHYAWRCSVIGRDADDLVRDCLVRAPDKLHTRRDDVDIRTWLFTIIHSLFVSQRRRARARPEPYDKLEELARLARQELQSPG